MPAWNTVASRIACLHPAQVAARRGGPDAARSLQSAGDDVPRAETILEKVQIDHTLIDVIVVDERERRPIGRPYLTLGLDEASRCALGMVVTLEAPSATSVGLCLGHMVCDKRPWLEELGVKVDWPMAGTPEQLYVDNAAEFKSEALRPVASSMVLNCRIGRRAGRTMAASSVPSWGGCTSCLAQHFPILPNAELTTPTNRQR